MCQHWSFTRSGSGVLHDHFPQGVGGLPRLHERLGLPVRHTLGGHTDALLLTLPVGQETDHEEDRHQHHWPRDQPHQLQGPKGQTLLHRVYKVTTMSYYFTFKCMLTRLSGLNNFTLFHILHQYHSMMQHKADSYQYRIIIQIIVLLFSYFDIKSIIFIVAMKRCSMKLLCAGRCFVYVLGQGIEGLICLKV